jgi:hypothetical protein
MATINNDTPCLYIITTVALRLIPALSLGRGCPDLSGRVRALSVAVPSEKLGSNSRVPNVKPAGKHRGEKEEEGQ